MFFGLILETETHLSTAHEMAVSTSAVLNQILRVVSVMHVRRSADPWLCPQLPVKFANVVAWAEARDARANAAIFRMLCMATETMQGAKIERQVLRSARIEPVGLVCANQMQSDRRGC